MDSYRKGQDILIKAAKEVLDSGYNIRVSFIGDGNKRSEFEELANKEGIKDKVDFYGLIKDKKFIQKIELDSHLFVLPTKSEGLPRSIIEAMSCGLPCIVSSVDGNSELISNNWLINSFDYHDYAKKIIEMLNDFSNMKKVGIENYNKSLEYDHTLLSKRRTSFYKKLKEIVYEK